MVPDSSKYSMLFSTLDEALHNFVLEVNKQNLQKMATQEWTVKDVLCHIVFWHTYYAQNYSALAQGKEPTIFTSKGGSMRNQKGVDSLKNKSKNELLEHLEKAQQELRECIVEKKVPEMDYTDHKKYKTEEFLNEIIRHIKNHTNQIIKAR